MSIRVRARHWGSDFQNPAMVTQPLRWSDLELVASVGRTPPQSNTVIPVNAGNRTGRHIVYTIWQASRLDQSYYFCGDVNFTS